jgi:hypothetical protein
MAAAFSKLLDLIFFFTGNVFGGLVTFSVERVRVEVLAFDSLSRFFNWLSLVPERV